MQKKSTIIIDGRLVNQNLEAEYKEMANDKTREAKALEWSEAVIGNVAAKLNEVHNNETSDLDNDLLKAQIDSLPKEQC